jgi:hypothetical protein
MLVQINDVSTNECPVSATTPWAMQMLSDHAESSRFEGAHLYGPDLSKWPADVFDAFSLFRYEDNRVENAKIDVDNGIS